MMNCEVVAEAIMSKDHEALESLSDVQCILLVGSLFNLDTHTRHTTAQNTQQPISALLASSRWFAGGLDELSARLQVRAERILHKQ